MVLEKVPVPVPSFVFESAMEGLEFLLQQTPRMVRVEPPSLEMLPPQEREVADNTAAAVVETVAREAEVFRVIEFP
jgi:hypothetical protein